MKEEKFNDYKTKPVVVHVESSRSFTEFDIYKTKMVVTQKVALYQTRREGGVK